MTTKTKSEGRYGSIDILKGIAIFLVILGHAAGNLDKPFYRIVLYSFHMPLFFIASGIMLKCPTDFGWQHWKCFLKKNIFALMIPFFIWGAIYSQFSYKNLIWVAYGSWQSLGKAGTLTSLWFIPCLFVARIMMELIFWIFSKIRIERHILSAIFCIPAFTIGMLLPKIEIGYFCCADIAFTALGFILLGYSSQILLKLFFTKLKMMWYFIAMFASLLLFITGTFGRSASLDLSLMCCRSYGNIFYFFFNALTGSMTVLFMSMIISVFGTRFHLLGSVKKLIMYIGSRTFGIFIIHKPILQQIFMPVLNHFGYTAYDFGAVFIASVCTLILTCLVLRILNKYTPQLLGKFPDLEASVQK